MAHSFPPNFGMGLGVGFEDASVLMEAMDTVGAEGNWWEIARMYEKKRVGGIDGFLELNREVVTGHCGRTTL